jgi:hypothetical protein
MSRAGLREAKQLGEQSTFFGRIAYYQASASGLKTTEEMTR